MVSILSGIHKYRRLAVPKQGVRPTLAKLRKTLFDILQEEVEGAEILDLFSGSGSLGLEALSRGASHVTFIEKDREHASYIKKNIAHLSEEKRTTLFVQDVFFAIDKLASRDMQFDLIFGDPPYGQGFAIKLIDALDRIPLLKPGGSFFVEDRFAKGEVVDLSNLKRLKLQSEREIGGAFLFHFRSD